MNSEFQLLLFSTEPPLILEAVQAGVDGIIVDWEHIGKEERQRFADTQINRDTVDDLQRVRACTGTMVVCRINRYGGTIDNELELAITSGADEILLPMVQSVGEVDHVLNRVAGRCGVGILVETVAALSLVEELGRLPLSRVYVGLNDLAIERKAPNIFTALADGTVDWVRIHFNVPFGFGGLTLPDHGFPVPCRLLIAEMARLNCSFSFLRRSFLRDIQGRSMSIEIPRLQGALREAFVRCPEVIAEERRELMVAIDSWVTTPNRR